MNRKNFLLDRCTGSKLELFIDFFNSHSADIPFSSIAGDLPNINHISSNSPIQLVSDSAIATGTFPSQPWLLTDQDLSYLAAYESSFHPCLIRYSIHQSYWKYHQLSEFYFDICNYWKSILTKNKIDAIFSFYTPHDPGSYALYLVSKLLKIPFIFIDIVYLAGQYRFYSCSLRDRLFLLNSINAAEFDTNYFFELNEYFDRLKHCDNFSETNILFSAKSFASAKRFIKMWLRKLFYSFKPLLFFKFSTYNFANHLTKPFSLSWFAIFVRLSLRSYFRKHAYLRQCVSISDIANIKYIYFPAPLEPEASTIPTALHNKHVIIALKRLISYLPSDVFIVFKVMPLQFDILKVPYSVYSDWHSPDFYRSIARLSSRILFVPDTISTLFLIDHSIGVSCINGTAPIEALCRGKVSLVFADNWYSIFNGIFCANDCLSIENFIQRCNSLNPPPFPKAIDAGFDKSAMFKCSECVNSDFPSDLVSIVGRGFLYSLDKFAALPNSKWDV